MTTEDHSWNDSDLDEIVSLFNGTLNTFSDSGDVAAKEYLLERLGKLVGADGTSWALGIHPQSDKHLAFNNFITKGFTEEELAKFVHALQHPDSVKATVVFYDSGRASGEQITMDEKEMDPHDYALSGELGKVWLSTGYGPTVLSALFVDETAVSVAGFYRKADRLKFDEREKRLIHMVLSGVSWLHKSGWPDDKEAMIPILGPRRHEVLLFLMKGKSNKDIAALLDMSINTLKDHVGALLKEFGVESRTELVAKIRGRGMTG